MRCEPFTVTDGYSRYLLACEAVAHGLPRALRTDNGSPFARRDGLGGLTQLSVWLLKLNVWPDRIQPGRPDQNGRHERMHRVLNEDVASPPAATLYTPSARAYPAAIKDWDYPADHQIRRVVGDGYIKWRDGTVHLSKALRGETVGVARRDDGDWAVRFRGFDLAILPEQGGALRRCALARMPVYNVT